MARVPASTYLARNPPGGARGEATPITATHKLLTATWTDAVKAAEAAIGDYTFSRPATNTCHVAMFEIPGDDRLHVNVTHRHQTRPVFGWAGPGSVPEGFVHNRTFSSAQPAHILRHIRSMVFAERL